MDDGVGSTIFWHPRMSRYQMPPACMFVLVLRWSRDLTSSVDDSGPTSINLLKATKFGDTVFRPALFTVI